MKKKDNTVKNDDTKESKESNVNKLTAIKSSIAKYEGVIIVTLAAICLTAILFAVKSSRATTEEILPQEGTQLVGTKDNENSKNSVVDAVPFCEGDLDFNILDYATYADFVNAGNTDAVYIVHDDSNIVKENRVEFLKHRFNNRRTETVRGIKLGDTLEKLYVTYGAPHRYDEYISDNYVYGDKEHKCVFMYMFRVDSVKDFFFMYTFVMDTNNEIIGITLEPIHMEYWTGPSTK